MISSLPDHSVLRSPGFLFGTATSSFQIEGDAGNRLESIWDTFCRKPGAIRDGSDGSVACDHVTRLQEDVDLMADFGLDAYRFSISWPRAVDRDGRLNDKGIGFYQRLIDRLNARGIKPFVTLYHWDLPQHLDDTGGWLNRDTAFRFAEYADSVSRALGDGVVSWATLNEPFCSAVFGYSTGTHAPGHRNPAWGRQAAHHLLLAHGLAMPALKSNCPDADAGIVLNFSPSYPESDRDEDRVAADIADQDLNQWYLLPVLEGRYPELLGKLPEGQRPDIRDGDLECISHPLDFLGVNYYFRGVYRAGANGGYVQVPQDHAPKTDFDWEIYPAGLGDLLIGLNDRYELPPVFITENGAAMKDEVSNGRVHDPERTLYIGQHLAELDRAAQAGVDIRGYFAWSLMDNFEWAEGYTKRFGLVYVDFETQERIIKDSGLAYRELLAGRDKGAA